MTLQVELVKKKDVGQFVQTVHDILVSIEDNLYSRDFTNSFLKELNPSEVQEDLKRTSAVYLVAKTHGQVIGFLYGQARYGVFLVTWLGVRVFYREKGVGRALMERLMKECKKRKFHKIMLYASSTDMRGITFCKKMELKKEAFLRRHWGKQDLMVFSKWI